MQCYYFNKAKAAILALLCIISTISNNLIAATFTVTKTTDSNPTRSGEFRWAIQQSNKTAGFNTINFNISGTGPFTITPTRDLNDITHPVTIDGYSQPGASVNTLATGNDANLLIVLSGNNYTEGNATAGTGNGLIFRSNATGSIVKGLVINGWINTGIVISNVNNISILGNYIGTNPQGTDQIANQAGIFIYSSKNTTIGTTNVADRNIFAGSFFYFNESACIEAVQSHHTNIVNNYIGTDKTGTSVLGNSLVGIECISCNNATIGGHTTTARNIIAGHAIMGISLIAVTNSNIKNNYIGTDVSGSIGLGNANIGISLSGSGIINSTQGNIISNNVISANNVGLKLGYAYGLGTNNNTIAGNLIGTDATGAVALANNIGIVIDDNTNTIGGTTTPSRNVISGNTVSGMLIYGSTIGNTIHGNYIGLNSTNTGALENGYGIQNGLAGNPNKNSHNTIESNSFGGSNTTSTLCP